MKNIHLLGCKGCGSAIVEAALVLAQIPYDYTEANYEDKKGLVELQKVDHIDDVRNYEYYLELNHQGMIVGGEWISKARPDFLWLMEKATNFGGMFHRLPELLND